MPLSFFRLAIPGVELSIEQNTESVPQDGKYHILQRGVVVASYLSLKRAREHAQKLREAAGQPPPPLTGQQSGEVLANKEHIERVLDAASNYWTSSHKFRGRGGRGGRGGV